MHRNIPERPLAEIQRTELTLNIFLFVQYEATSICEHSGEALRFKFVSRCHSHALVRD